MAVSTLRSMGSGSCWGGGEGGEGAGASGDPLGVVGLGADGAGGAGAGVWVGGVGRGGVAGAGAGAGPESTRDRTAKRPGLARRRSRPPGGMEGRGELAAEEMGAVHWDETREPKRHPTQRCPCHYLTPPRAPAMHHATVSPHLHP